ncbi:MAG: IclR family transcriptional regulator [Terriglobia bacterium]
MGSLAAEESGFRDPSVPSVDRALNLIELLASTTAGLNLSMISRKLNIPKSSAYYLVTTLLKRNLVRRSPDRRVYSLGTLAPSFAKINRAESDLKKFCSPYIQSLSNKLGMTAQLGIREGAEARIIDRSEMAGPRLDSWVGRHFDLHCTAIGKALISYLPDTEVENLFRSRGFPKHNENTVGSLEVLKSHLAETRKRGFTTDDEEHELGVRCVASPIFNHLAGVVGAICVFTSSNRLSRPEMPALGAEVMKTASDLSRALNGSPLDVQRVLQRWESGKRSGLEA